MDEQGQPVYSASRRLGGPRRSAAVVAAGAAGLLLIGAAGFAFAASPAPSGSGAASGAPAASPSVDAKGGGGLGPLARGLLDGRIGPGRAFGAIHITAISGSSVSLATDDGWTRTIMLDQDTKLTRAGTAISAGDLKVGDEVRLAETKASDGSYTIKRLDVVLPTVAGQVTAKGSDSLTIKRLDGTSETIHVSASTTYRTRGNASASLADVTVGSNVIATGNARSDGSIDAVEVLSGTPTAFEGRRGLGLGRGPRAKGGPNAQGGQQGATPAPSSSTS